MLGSISLLFLVVAVLWYLRRQASHNRAAATKNPTVRQDKATVSPKSSSSRPSSLESCDAQKLDIAKPPPIPPSMSLRGRAYVIDGDTIVVQKTKIRLAGIDAPELDKPWGQKSKWEMVRICTGEILDVKLTGQTSYDRLVGTCYLSDGRDIGAELVRSGLALDGGHYSKGKYRHLEQPGMRAKLINYGHRRKRA